MVKVSKTYYDADHDGSYAGNEPKPYVTGVRTLKALATANYVLTKYEYDTAGRQSVVILSDPDGAGALKETKIERIYDDLGRFKSHKTYKKDGETETLFAQTDNEYNAVGVTSTKVYEVSSGSAGNYLKTDYDYDGYGVCKVTRPGGAFTKTIRNAYGRVTGTYLCSEEGANTDPELLTNDVVVEQSIPYYDEDTGAVWMTAKYERNHNATGTGALLVDDDPEGRASYTVNWYDDVNRLSSTV